MSEKQSATLLGFDFGERRIGVAVGQTVSSTASPLTTINARGGRAVWPEVAKLVDRWQPEALVVGLPCNMDGSRHALAARVERFARQLHGRFHLPVHMMDERLSSHEAEQRESTGPDNLDAHAAQIILESWLADQEIQRHAP